jgi:hypothetical protein
VQERVSGDVFLSKSRAISDAVVVGELDDDNHDDDDDEAGTSVW